MTLKAIKILALEDNDFDFDFIKRQLNKLEIPHKLTRAVCKESYLECIAELKPDLILSDFSIPSFSGLEALKIAQADYPYIPFMFVSGTIGEELAVKSLKQGAVDYILKENLSRLVPAVKRALEEAEEKHQRRLAEEKLSIKVNELKTLVYKISHDIKGPVCTIKGAIGLYRNLSNKNSAECDNCISLVENIVSNLEGILANLSSFQHVYSRDLTFSEVNIKELIEETVENLSNTDRFNEVDINIKVEGERKVCSEKNLLLLILYNIIHNSICFSDPDKPKQKVTCRIASHEGEIEIYIEDNGIGIPNEIQPKVTEMFFRGSTRSKGAGLGLYIIKNVLERLNGHIHIESSEKVGSQITIKIPRQMVA